MAIKLKFPKKTPFPVIPDVGDNYIQCGETIMKLKYMCGVISSTSVLTNMKLWLYLTSTFVKEKVPPPAATLTLDR